MADHDEDDFAPTTTSYKVGEKKTIDEYANLDANDESLRKWKESLGLNKAAGAAGPADDPRRVVIHQLALEISGRDDVVLDLSSPDAIEAAKQASFTIKEGTEYRMKVLFRVQHEVISGLKYLQVVKRRGVRVDKSEEMIGSYGPQEQPYEKKFVMEEAPAGMLSRGHYEAKSKFVDDDNVTHMEWSWSFDIKKDW